MTRPAYGLTRLAYGLTRPAGGLTRPGYGKQSKTGRRTHALYPTGPTLFWVQHSLCHGRVPCVTYESYVTQGTRTRRTCRSRSAGAEPDIAAYAEAEHAIAEARAPDYQLWHALGGDVSDDWTHIQECLEDCWTDGLLALV